MADRRALRRTLVALVATSALVLAACGSKVDRVNPAFGTGSDARASSEDAAGDDGATTTEVTFPVAGPVCEAQRTGPWSMTPSDADVLGLIRTAALPPAPITGEPALAKISQEDYASAAASLSEVPDRDARVSQAEEAGYADGTMVSYQLGATTTVAIRAARFRDGEAAVSFGRAQLGNLCATPMAQVRFLPDHAGILYEREDAPGIGYASFVLGDTELTISVCECVPGDAMAVVEAWYDAIVEQVGTGRAVEVT